MTRRILFTAAVGMMFYCATLPSLALPNFRTAAEARSWAEHAERTGNYADAAAAYQYESTIRRRTGDPQGAEVELRKAQRLKTDIVFAVQSTPGDSANDSPDSSPSRFGRPEREAHNPNSGQTEERAGVGSAKWEPDSGCYIGVRDDFEGQYYGRDTANSENFAQRVDHPVAVALDYDDYGRPFPVQWAEREHQHGRAIQIAWEPKNIYAVQDDDYLNNWAEAAAQSGAPIFLRFGGEMNGEWTSWGRNPAAYRRAFRTVAKVMRRRASNVAMVWAPNSIPTTNLDSYYPGDDVVDWVGISLYIVRFYDDNLSRPAFRDSVESLIDPFYQKYARRKPLCLAECGITRRSRVEESDADGFAADRIVDLMEAIKIRYPRLKMATFFDRNNLRTAQAGRRLNDYSLPPGSLALTALRKELEDPYFLGHVRRQSTAPVSYTPTSSVPAGYHGDVFVSLSTYSVEPYLQVRRGDTVLKVARPFEFAIPDGDGPLQITVYDDKGRIAKKAQLNTQ